MASGERTDRIANARLRQVRLPCVSKRRVGHAFFHLARIIVCPLAFFTNPVDLVVVAPQIEGRVHDREEDNRRDYCDARRPQTCLLLKSAGDASA